MEPPLPLHQWEISPLFFNLSLKMKGTVINSKGWVHKKGKGLSRGVPEPDWEGSQFVFICWEIGGGAWKAAF